MTLISHGSDSLSDKESREAREAASVLTRALKEGSLYLKVGSGKE